MELVKYEAGQLSLPGEVTPVSLQLPDGLKFEAWEAIGGQISECERSVMWWMGDWWRYGDQAYGERAAQALDSDYGFQAWADAGWVAGKIESSRRHEVLTWSHHREVAALDPEQQDELLRWAAAEGATRNELRAKVKADKRDQVRRLKADQGIGVEPPSGIDIRHQDCMEMIASLPDNSVSLLLTDPPYAVTENDWDQWDSEADYLEFMADWLSQMAMKMAPESTAFIFCDASMSPKIYQVLNACDWLVLRQVIWHRPNLAKKRSGANTFLSSYEPFWHCGTTSLNFPDEWGSERFDVQEFTAPQSNHKNDQAVHPTQKPVALFKRLVELGCSPGELVVDPFCGSGTTVLACKQLNRRCTTCDTDKEYVAIARGRIADGS